MRAEPDTHPTPEEVVQELRSTASVAPADQVALLPGLSDSEIDSWDCLVPEDVRSILRRTAGLKLESDVDTEYFSPVDPLNLQPERPAYIRSGGRGEFRIIHSSDIPQTFYVDIDPKTGSWGRVFLFGEDDFTKLISPDFFCWMSDVCMYVRRASEDFQAGRYVDFEEALLSWLYGDFANAQFDYPEGDEGINRKAREMGNPNSRVLSASEVRRSTDPVMVAISQKISEGAFVSDLRGHPYPTLIPFGDHPDWPRGFSIYSRYHGGDFIVATPQE